MRSTNGNLLTRYITVTLLMCAMCGSYAVLGQGKPSIKWGNLNLLGMDTVWKYKSGPASPEFFAKDFDDRSWKTVSNKSLDGIGIFDSTWKGIGVFRKRFNMPDTLKGRPFELLLTQFGASEIYLDGRL